jgi:hypothetical protein
MTLPFTLPSWILTAVSLVEMAVKAAPDAITIVNQARAFFGSLFSAGQISVEQQTAVSARLEAITQAVLRGEVPPAWQVEPDPE